MPPIQNFTAAVYDYFDKSKILRHTLGQNMYFISMDVVSNATVVLLFRLNYVEEKTRKVGPTVELRVNISATDDERRVNVTVIRTDDQDVMGMHTSTRCNPSTKYTNVLWCADKADARNIVETVSNMCNNMLHAEHYNFRLNELT